MISGARGVNEKRQVRNLPKTGYHFSPLTRIRRLAPARNPPKRIRQGGLRAGRAPCKGLADTDTLLNRRFAPFVSSDPNHFVD